MKWFMCINGNSQDHLSMSRVAVLSALKNTTLEPHLVYDGFLDEYSEWMVSKGVRVHYRTLTYLEEFRKCGKEKRAIGSGAFLRTEIPLLARSLNFPEKYILYTDCDVMFLKDPLTNIAPEYFACGPESDQQEQAHCNTGVMYMNLHSLYYTFENFKKHIVEYLGKRSGYDQPMYNSFYESMWESLPLDLNWKPYWGFNEGATILHWHGPKPSQVAAMKTMPNPQNYGALCSLWKRDPESYDKYIEIWESFFISPQ